MILKAFATTALVVVAVSAASPASALIRSGINVNDVIGACERDAACSYNVDPWGGVSGQSEHGTFSCNVPGTLQGAQGGPKGAGYTCVWSDK